MTDTLLRVVGMNAVSYDDDQSQNVRRHGEQLGHISREPEVCNDGRGEIAEGVEAVDHEEVGCCVHPKERLEQRLFRNLEIERLVFFLGSKWTHSCDRERALFIGEEFSVLWIVGHPFPDNRAKQDGRDTSQDEKPLLGKRQHTLHDTTMRRIGSCPYPTSQVCFAVQERDA